MGATRRRKRRAPVVHLAAGECIHQHSGCPSWADRPVWCDQCHVWHCDMKPNGPGTSLDDPDPLTPKEDQ